MVNWDDFRFLLALHRHRTMTAAADVLRTNVATVSRRIERVSEDLGAPVFQKEGGAWKATVVGLRFVNIAKDFEAEVRREENNLAVAQGTSKTHLTLLAPPMVLSSALIPAMDVLLKDMPNLSLTFQNRFGAEGLGDADLFLRWGQPEHGRLATKKITSVVFRPYRRGDTEFCGWVSLEEKHDHTRPAKLGQDVYGVPPRLRTAHVDHKILLMEDLGYAGILPEIIGDNNPKLRRDPDHENQSISLDLWYCFHTSRRDDMVLRRVVDWAVVACRADFSNESIIKATTDEAAPTGT